MRRQRGQTAVEYLGVLLVITVIVAAVATTDAGEKVARGMESLVCRIAGGQCDAAPPTAAETEPDADRDGVADAQDPVPDSADVDHDGLTDGEELALGSDSRKADTDGDGTPDRAEYERGTDPTQGVLPQTKDNVLTPWERVGLSQDEWRDFEQAILDDVEPGGILGFLAGPSYAGVTLDEHGELQLIALQEMGVNPFKLVRLFGAGSQGLSAAGTVVRAAGKLPAAARAALVARGVLPAIARIKPPVPPAGPGVALGELDGLGRTTGAAATITRTMLGTGTAASRSIRPAGFISGEVNHARGHLIARALGGSGKDPRNLVTLYQNPVNTPVMRRFEQQVINAVRAGQTVKYEVQPIYRGSELIPRGVTLRATGSNGFRLNVTVLNTP